MDLAVVIADTEHEWLQRVFLETGRMPELVEALASISKAMLKLGEHDRKGAPAKKRGSKGETLKIWEMNAAN
jgi:nuclear pore complex protein Nup107